MLKFSKDKRRWLRWLFEAKKRYGVSILNYTVTSNHVHVLVVDDGDRDVIPNSIQLIAGITGQDRNIIGGKIVKVPFGRTVIMPRPWSVMSM